MVKAAGVELFGVLITRKLLILGIAKTAKKAPLPDPLYVYCTKMLFALEFRRNHSGYSIPQIRRAGSRKNYTHPKFFVRVSPEETNFAGTLDNE